MPCVYLFGGRLGFQALEVDARRTVNLKDIRNAAFLGVQNCGVSESTIRMTGVRPEAVGVKKNTNVRPFNIAISRVAKLINKV